MGFEKGEYGKVLNRIEKRFVCPACPKTFKTDTEVMEHFDDEHTMEDLE